MRKLFPFYLRVASNWLRRFGAKLAICVLFVMLGGHENGYSATERVNDNHSIKIAGIIFKIPSSIGLQYYRNEVSGAETLLLLVPISLLGVSLSQIQGRKVEYISLVLETGEDYTAIMASYERAAETLLRGLFGGYRTYDFGSEELLFVGEENLRPHFFLCHNYPDSSLSLVGANFCYITERINDHLPAPNAPNQNVILHYDINRNDLSKLKYIDSRLTEIIVNMISNNADNY